VKLDPRRSESWAEFGKRPRQIGQIKRRVWLLVLHLFSIANSAAGSYAIVKRSLQLVKE